MDNIRISSRLPLEVQRLVGSYSGPVDYVKAQSAGLFVPDDNYFAENVISLPYMTGSKRVIRYLYHRTANPETSVYFNPDCLYGLRKQYRPSDYANYRQVMNHIRSFPDNVTALFYGRSHVATMEGDDTRDLPMNMSVWSSWLYYCSVMVTLTRDDSLSPTRRDEIIKQAMDLDGVSENDRILAQSPSYMYDCIVDSTENPWDNMYGVGSIHDFMRNIY